MLDDWEEEELDEGIPPDAPEPQIRQLPIVNRPQFPTLPAARRFEPAAQDEGTVGDDAREALNKLTDMDEQDREELFGTGNLGDASREAEDDLSDLTDITPEDEDELFHVDEPEPSRPEYRISSKGRRSTRRFTPPPSGLSGLRL